MKLCGITGGIASGKSEITQRLAALGIPVLDADRMGHACIAPGGAAETAVVEAFGAAILTDGAIDRAKLGALVFGDAAKRERLNALVHPCIHAEIHRQVRALARQGHAVAVLDAALIAEDGQRPECLDFLVVVNSARETRIRRLMETRGLTETEAIVRVDAQTPPERKIPLADLVIDNEGDLASLHTQADALATRLMGDLDD